MIDALRQAFQSVTAWFAGTDVDGIIPLNLAVETEVSTTASHAGTTDVYITSPTLLAAAQIRAGEVARAKLAVVDLDGAEVENLPVAQFLRRHDTAMLIESTAHDYYISGRAYWQLNRGYNLTQSSERQIQSITRLEPRKVTRVRRGTIGESTAPIYRYEGREIADEDIVPFERYDGTSALSRLSRYLEIERNTLRNRAIDSRYKKPKYGYTSPVYKIGNEEVMRKDAQALGAAMSSTTNEVVVVPLRPDAKLEYISIPFDAELAQVREVTIQAVSADSGVPGQFLSSEESFVRWNSVRDARRTLWESHLMRELDRMSAVLTNKLVGDDPNLRVIFDTSSVQVLGDSREVESKNTQAYIAAARDLLTLGADAETVSAWLSERVGVEVEVDLPAQDGAD